MAATKQDYSADRLLWTRSMLACPNCCKDKDGNDARGLCDFHERGLDLLGLRRPARK